MKQIKFACFAGASIFLSLLVFLFPVKIQQVLILKPIWEAFSKGEAMFRDATFIVPAASASFIWVHAVISLAVGLIIAVFPPSWMQAAWRLAKQLFSWKNPFLRAIRRIAQLVFLVCVGCLAVVLVVAVFNAGWNRLINAFSSRPPMSRPQKTSVHTSTPAQGPISRPAPTNDFENRRNDFDAWLQAVDANPYSFSE